jgi:L-seryl-tRNA(Ser) seleniumtransferase
LLKKLQADAGAISEAFSLEQVESASGGGALPELTLSSWAISITTSSAAQLAERLRLGTPSVFARVQQGKTLIDLRTVLPQDEDALVTCLQAALQPLIPG